MCLQNLLNQSEQTLMYTDQSRVKSRCALQWLAARNPFCAYGSHYDVEFHSLEPSQYYPVVLLRFLAYQEMLDSLPPGRCALSAFAGVWVLLRAGGQYGAATTGRYNWPRRRD